MFGIYCLTSDGIMVSQGGIIKSAGRLLEKGQRVSPGLRSRREKFLRFLMEQDVLLGSDALGRCGLEQEQLYSY